MTEYRDEIVGQRVEQGVAGEVPLNQTRTSLQPVEQIVVDLSVPVFEYREETAERQVEPVVATPKTVDVASVDNPTSPIVNTPAQPPVVTETVPS